MKLISLLLLILLGGCSKDIDDSALGLKNKLDQLTLPSNKSSILSQPSDEIIHWLIEIDRWKIRVLATPSDTFSVKEKEAVESTLKKIFSQQVTDNLIATFYTFDSKTNMYAKKNLGHNTLDSSWEYEPVVVRVTEKEATITAKGKKLVDNKLEFFMNHESMVEIQNNEIRFIEFITKE